MALKCVTRKKFHIMIVLSSLPKTMYLLSLDTGTKIMTSLWFLRAAISIPAFRSHILIVLHPLSFWNNTLIISRYGNRVYIVTMTIKSCTLKFFFKIPNLNFIVTTTCRNQVVSISWYSCRSYDIFLTLAFSFESLFLSIKARNLYSLINTSRDNILTL